MDPMSARDLAPRLILGLFIALAAVAGAFAVNQFDGTTSADGATESVASRGA